MTNYQKYNSGQALMTAVIFFLFISLAVVFGLTFSAVSTAKISKDLIDSKKSYFLAEAGDEDVIYRILNGKNYSLEEVIMLDNSFATTAILDIGGDVEINSIGEVSENIRKIKTSLTNDTGTSFHYGVQVGDGGLTMDNSSMVTGNVYSNGPIESYSSNEIKGDTISAGPDGSVKGVHATGTVYAHNIDDSLIEKDAYYQTISNTTVWGTLYPDSPDQPPADLPITDEVIDEWKAAASSTSIITSPCPYEIDDDTTLGPVKIECDLEIGGNPTVVLMGPVWVEGNIIIENTAIIRIDSSLGSKSVVIIADNPSDRLTSSKIRLENSVTFQNSGSEGSYILMLSQNNSAENGGDEKAIHLKNTVGGDLLLYAGHGKIHLNNKSDLREVTGYAVYLTNQANIIYETGLGSLLFESGPAGGFSISSWEEVE